jgi:hypothetical protein
MRVHTPVQRDVLALGWEHSKLVRPPHVTAPPMGLRKRDSAMNTTYKAPPTTSACLSQDTSNVLLDKTRCATWGQRWT